MRTQRFQHLRSQVCLSVAALILVTGQVWAASNGKLLYSFTGGNDGGDPATRLVFDNSGNAYGTTVTGGFFGCGTVFQLTPAGGGFEESVLYSFSCGADGKNPYGGVTLDGAGNLYGTTVAGGSGGACAGDGCGTVFQLTKSGNTWSETAIYNFTGGSDGFGPGAGLARDQAGNLYGTTPDGGAHSAGVVFELSPMQNGSWKQTVLHAFTGGNDGGVGSLGVLLLDTAGNLYGTAELGGAHQAGTVFELTPSSPGQWTFTTLHAFKGTPDAGFPYGGLILDSNGHLYGTTYYGGKYGSGAVFEMGMVSGKWAEGVLYSFTGGSDGGNSTSTLVFDSLGNLYGTTSAGGNAGCGCGTVFQLTPTRSGTWKESTLHAFGNSPDGANPYYGLNPDAAGHLFSTTAVGGAHGQGIIFEFTP